MLDKLVEALPASRHWQIIVFGSAPLQLGIDSAFASGDVDIIPQEDVSSFCDLAGLLKGQCPIYVEPCTIAAFTASADWFVRAHTCVRRHVSFVFPHPIDILVSKIKRLEEKDLAAYRMVRAKTGHPTEDELIGALQRMVDVYRPNFDEESSGDPMHNTQVLWQELFKKPIDVRQVIIAPALTARKQHYQSPGSGLKSLLGLL